MQPYSYSIALRIWHPTIDPAVIGGKLGLPAKFTHVAGHPRQTPKGRTLGGTYAESYWHSDPFERGEYLSTDESAEDALASVLEALQQSKQFLLLLREQGARVHLQVSTHSARNYALEISPQLQEQCAAMGLSLVHDVYPNAQRF